MSIDTWVVGTIDPGASKKPDGSDQVHVWKRNTANAGDIVIAFDRAKVGSRTVLRAAILQGLKILEGGGELTA